MKISFRALIGRKPDGGTWMVCIPAFGFSWDAVEPGDTRDEVHEKARQMIESHFANHADIVIPPPDAEHEKVDGFEVMVWEDPSGEEDEEEWWASVPSLGYLATAGPSRDEVLSDIHEAIWEEVRSREDDETDDPVITNAESIELEVDIPSAACPPQCATCHKYVPRDDRVLIVDPRFNKPTILHTACRDGVIPKRHITGGEEIVELIDKLLR